MKDDLDREYEERQLERRETEEAKTAKKRAKRQKRKQKMQAKRRKKEVENTGRDKIALTAYFYTFGKYFWEVADFLCILYF